MKGVSFRWLPPSLTLSTSRVQAGNPQTAQKEQQPEPSSGIPLNRSGLALICQSNHLSLPLKYMSLWVLDLGPTVN